MKIKDALLSHHQDVSVASGETLVYNIYLPSINTFSQAVQKAEPSINL